MLLASELDLAPSEFLERGADLGHLGETAVLVKDSWLTFSHSKPRGRNLCPGFSQRQSCDLESRASELHHPSPTCFPERDDEQDQTLNCVTLE